MASTSEPTKTIISDRPLISSANRGPIISLWELPASCTATLSSTPGLLYFGHHGSVFGTSCYPTGSNGAVPTASNDWASFYHSPAICPYGWVTATTFSASFGIFPSPRYLSLGPETSAALCCPSGYSYYENGPQCFSAVSQEQLITYYSYSLVDNEWRSGKVSTLALGTSTIVKGDGIPIFWQQSDSAVLARASTLTRKLQASSLLATPGPSSVAPSTSPTLADTPAPPSHGLSTGAKIGLGVGIPMAIIALLAIGFLVWRRRRNQQVLGANEVVHIPDNQTEYKDAPGYGLSAGHNGNGQPQFHEMQTSPEEYHNRHELPSVAHR
ncbi:hypothetical protein FB567DRAFT_576852 [Paraphoma chrysanthemicola]|uniref:Uncharacterized protein n=1 Tax=Paraphoma chrysanthemicola TaxID=798071 RepID=A0A8K0W2X6_9PLEO|nr:hypothetical protein FB567DRAFT_576852 [Paraphoma chrysanthemicola]